MEKVIPSLIYPSQSALDPILIANEVVEEYREKKAFDRIDWEFLENVLNVKGFTAKWIQRIIGCVKNPKFSIFINGKPRGKILASRVLVSRFLVLLVSKLLSILVELKS